MPLKEVEVAECFVDGGEAERDKEARESAAVFEASLIWRVRMELRYEGEITYKG
jgi:hypothetical protein